MCHNVVLSNHLEHEGATHIFETLIRARDSLPRNIHSYAELCIQFQVSYLSLKPFIELWESIVPRLTKFHGLNGTL